jgi:hypothetical protein
MAILRKSMLALGGMFLAYAIANELMDTKDVRVESIFITLGVLFIILGFICGDTTQARITQNQALLLMSEQRGSHGTFADPESDSIKLGDAVDTDSIDDKQLDAGSNLIWLWGEGPNEDVGAGSKTPSEHSIIVLN